MRRWRYRVSRGNDLNLSILILLLQYLNYDLVTCLQGNWAHDVRYSNCSENNVKRSCNVQFPVNVGGSRPSTSQGFRWSALRSKRKEREHRFWIPRFSNVFVPTNRRSFVPPSNVTECIANYDAFSLLPGFD